MGFFDFFRGTPKSGQHHTVVDVTINELESAARDYYVKELAFWTCVNIIASALGRCEVKTFVSKKETKDREYFIWNIQPNKNENSTMFWHKFAARLYEDNEVIIVNREPGNENDIVIADSYSYDEFEPEKGYSDIQIGNKTISHLDEADVLHIKLQHKNMYPILQGLFDAYAKLVSTAVKAYNRGMGQHWKVHVSQMAQNGEGWIEAFQEMIEKQVKPFFEGNSAILPEFDGYDYKNVDADAKKPDTRDIKAIFDDVFEYTARGMLIPPVLTAGKVESTADANRRFLTNCIDPLTDQLEEEITRKRYGFSSWKHGNFVKIDTSSILHFDIFDAAASIEKVIGSGVWSPNDILEACGQARIDEEWADAHYMTLNISRLGDTTQKMSGKEVNK